MNFPPNQSDFDARFSAIIKGLTAAIVEITEQSVAQIMQASTTFLSDSAQKALANFHSLYFSAGDLSEQNSDVNKEVDVLFDSIQTQVAAGKSENEISAGVYEDAEKKQARLALSAFQKQLESLITVEAGVREKLVPVLMSMQFEYFVRQRLSHITLIWDDLLEALNQDNAKTEAVTACMLTRLTSNGEKEVFYRVVLQQEPPANLAQEQTWFTDLT